MREVRLVVEPEGERGGVGWESEMWHVLFDVSSSEDGKRPKAVAKICID